MARATSSAAPPRSSAESGVAAKVAKTQIVEQIAERTGLSRRQAASAVTCVVETMIEALRAGRSVGLPGLGTLSVSPTRARQGVRPGTSDKIQIPAGKKIRFKAATTLKGQL